MMTAPGRAVMVHTQCCDGRYLCRKTGEKWNFAHPKGCIKIFQRILKGHKMWQKFLQDGVWFFTHTHPWAYEKGSYDNCSRTILGMDCERLTAMPNTDSFHILISNPHFSRACLFTGVRMWPLDHYPWCIWPHCTLASPSLAHPPQTRHTCSWDFTVQATSPIPTPLPAPPPPRNMWWWPLKQVRFASGWYASYWNGSLFPLTFGYPWLVNHCSSSVAW